MSFLFVVVVMPLVIIRNDLEIALLQFQMSFKLWIVYRFHLIIFVSVVWKNYLYTYIEVHKLQFRFISDQEISSEKLKRLVVFRQGIKKNHVFTRDLLAAFPKKKFFFDDIAKNRRKWTYLYVKRQKCRIWQDYVTS